MAYTIQRRFTLTYNIRDIHSTNNEENNNYIKYYNRRKREGH